MKNKTNAVKTQAIDHDIAFKMGNNILDRWGCSTSEKQKILGISDSSLFQSQNKLNLSLSDEQLVRISYLANIHETLRLIFSNSDNVYMFMNATNNNSYFKGRSPLSILKTGSIDALHHVCRRLESLRN